MLDLLLCSYIVIKLLCTSFKVLKNLIISIWLLLNFKVIFDIVIELLCCQPGCNITYVGPKSTSIPSTTLNKSFLIKIDFNFFFKLKNSFHSSSQLLSI
jgi:hypothetical protein